MADGSTALPEEHRSRYRLFGAATVASAVSLVSLGGRMVFGWLVDRLLVL